MAIDEVFFRNEGKEIVVYLFLAMIFAIIVPIFLGFALTGFSESFVEGASLVFGSFLLSFLIYIPFTIVTIVLVIYPIASLLVIRKGEHPATQENPTIFRVFTVSFLFAPENGLLYRLFDRVGFEGRRNPMRFAKKILRVLGWSIVVFGILGIGQIAFPQLQIVGIPQIQAQQVSPTTEVLFTSFVPAWAETMTILFLLFFMGGIIAYFTAKFIRDKDFALIIFFTLLVLVASPLIGLSWGGIHNIVYGNSEVALFSAILFGFLGSIMTILTGTFIPFFVWHVMNNLFAKLLEIAPINEDVLFIAGGILAIFFLFMVSMEVWAFLRRRKRGGRISEISI